MDLVLRNLLRADLHEPGVQLRSLRLERLQPDAGGLDRPLGRHVVEPRGRGREAVDGDPQRLSVGPLGPDHADAELLELLGELGPQLPQGPVGLGGDQHPLALCEEV